MQQVITEVQARKITGGRKPLVPVVYEEALKALDACVSLDEAKYWDNKADALAAWAKIYHDDEAQRKAKALKLWAYRRMGEIAGELRPVKNNPLGGASPGPLSLLMESGMSRMEAVASRRLARAKRTEVEKIASTARPPSPLSILGGRGFNKILSPSQIGGRVAFSNFQEWPTIWNRLISAVAAISHGNPSDVAATVRPEVAAHVRAKIQPLIDWLDEFEQHLPKDGSHESSN